MGLKAKALLVVALSLAGVATHLKLEASDHDDGEFDSKGRSLNLTDLYVFREDWQTGSASDQGNLVLIMNTNPLSLPKHQYYFSTNARYEFHLRRAPDKTLPYTDGEDVTLRFTFGEPNGNRAQPITLTAVKDGVTFSGGVGLTTPLGTANANNSVSIGGSTLTVFAGLKEDPFFFDVEQFFRVRAGIAADGGTGPLAPSFRATNRAVDFAAGSNVNAIVVRVPLAFLQTDPSQKVFDVWETVSIPQ